MDGRLDYTIRSLGFFDIDQAMQLNVAAGWNQTSADWKMMLSCKGYHLAATVNEQIVATIASLDYEQFVWIAMVLVDPSFRRKGIATTLLKNVMAQYADRLLRLDATAAGSEVYSNLGFRKECYLHRWVLKRSTPPTISKQHRKSNPVLDLDELLIRDQKIFGGDRSSILHTLYQANGAIALSDAYLFSRAGHKAQQLGPLVASDLPTAKILVDSCIAHSESSLFYLDALENRGWENTLTQLGFRKIRKFVRMQKGPLTDVGQPQYQYAIGGPEIG